MVVCFDVGLTEEELIERAAVVGVGLDGAGSCFTAPPAQPHILLGYAAMPEEQIRAGIRQLRRALA